MQESLPTLYIHLLGGFQLISGETPVGGIDVPRLQSLFAYLLLHHGVPQSRSHLAYMFWPDTTDGQALTNLRNIVHKLRLALPNVECYLQVERQVLFWKEASSDSPWMLDVLDFDKAITEASQTNNESVELRALTRAVKLYRGDLLPSCYDDWLLSERDRLRQVFVKALERLIELQEKERDYGAAISSAQQLLQYDPLHEATYRHLMRLYATSGDRAVALRTYHACSTTLERELGVQPGKATREVYERLLQTEGPSTEQKSASPTLLAAAPLVGRQSEWTQLLAAWRHATSGHPYSFLLTGEAGIGKTRLAEELLNWAGRQGVATAIARCYAAEGKLAYAPVATWLDSNALRAGLATLADIWLTEVARLLPNLHVEKPALPRPGTMTESWQRQRFFEALARATLQRNQPLLLLLDDVQWCDRETLEWLHYLLRFDSNAPLLLVYTARTEEMTNEPSLAILLANLRREGLLTGVELDPLNAAETASLAAHLSGEDLDSTIIAALYQETEGNPLFVVETVRAGAVERVRTGQLSLEEQHVRPGALLPPTVQAVISSRLAQLTPGAQEVIGLAAVIGRAFTFKVLRRASSMDEDALVLGLDELWQRRVVREQGGDAYDFSHDKLREQAYVSLSAARKRLLHRRVGDALVALYGHDAGALGAVSGQIAAHYEQAGAVEQAIRYNVRAAEEARRVYANVEAIAFYMRVLRLLEQMPHDDRKREWQQEMATQCDECNGDILAVTGEVEAARDAYQHALSLVTEHNRIHRAGLLCKLATTWEMQQRYEKCLQACHEAEVVLGTEPTVPVIEWWQVWIDLQDKKMDIYGQLSRLSEMAEILEQMRPIVQQYGTPMQRAEFFLSSALTLTKLKRFEVSAEDLAEAHAGLAAYEALGDPLKIGWSHLSLAFLYQLKDGLVEAEEHTREALDLGERTGDVMMQMLSLNMLALVCRKRGQAEEVRRVALRTLAMAEALHQPVAIGQNKANLAWLAWREGNFAEAQALGQEALEEWQALQVNYYYMRWTALLPLLAVALVQDRLAEAVEYARELLAPDQQYLPDALSTTIEAVIRAWDAGQPGTARTNLQQLIVVAREAGYL